MQLSLRKQRAKYIVTDWVMTALAFFFFNIVRFILLSHEDISFDLLERYIDSTKLLIEQFTIPTVLLGIYWLSGYYNKPFERSRLQEAITTLQSAVLNAVLIYLALLTNDQIVLRKINWGLLIILSLLLFICTYSGRLALTSQTLKKFRRRNLKINTLIIGASESAERLSKTLEKATPRYGYSIPAYVEIPGESRSKRLSNVFPMDTIPELIERYQVKQFVISPEQHNDRLVLDLLNKLFHYNLPIKIAPDDLSYVTSGIHMQDIFSEPFVDLASPTITEGAKNLKRVIDVIVSFLALIILSPVYAAVAIAVKVDSRGPVFYRQVRIGLHQQPFRIIKFRSMRTDAEAAGPALTVDNDQRVTKVGRFLRKYRLDEIPQFWNVLIGDMSLVGPRPERQVFIDKIVARAPYYTMIHQVRPGITSWGMVKFGYASTVDQMIDRLKYDLIYLSNMSTAVDLKIMIYTIQTVVTGRGQ